MNKTVRLIVFSILIATLGFGSSPVFAKGGGQGGDKPSGFSKGEKKGWEGKDTPPGWSEGKKKGWGDEGTPPGLSANEKTGKKGKAKHAKANS